MTPRYIYTNYDSPHDMAEVIYRMGGKYARKSKARKS